MTKGLSYNLYIYKNIYWVPEDREYDILIHATVTYRAGLRNRGSPAALLSAS